MARGQAVAAVALQEALKLEERYSGYRAAVGSALRELLKSQDLGESENARRKRVEERISDLATKAMHSKGQD